MRCGWRCRVDSGLDSPGPYRADPLWRVCPRCDELLEENLPGSALCPRCAGAWISQAVIDGAFGDPTWPGGSSLWWQRALNCPKCGASGKKSLMDAIEAHGVIVDRCRGHGIWFDAGELQRAIRIDADPFGWLRERMALSRTEIDAARASYERRLEHAREGRLRKQAHDASERALAQEREAQRTVDALNAATDPRALQRLEIAEAIAGKVGDLVAAQRHVLRLESDLAVLRERMFALGPGNGADE